MNENHYDVVIIGSGFRALTSAYLNLKKNKKVLIISKSRDLLGIMSPINWLGSKFDKGYQFFDGIDNQIKELLIDFVGKDILYDFGFGAGSLTNNKLKKGTALPYWPSYGVLFCLKEFIKHLNNYTKNITLKINSAKSHADLINLLPSDISKILYKEFEKKIGIDPSFLSFGAHISPQFHFRMSIFNDFFTNYLRKFFPYLNETLASSRHSLGMPCISLYPKNEYIGFAGEKMLEFLAKKKTSFIISENLKILNNSKENINIYCNGIYIKSKKIFIVTDLDDIPNFFEKKIFFESSLNYIPQLFYYFSTKNSKSNLQYVMGNTENNLINRANNLSLYGQKTENGEFVISAEVMRPIDDIIWKDPEKYLVNIWNEIKLMKLVSTKQNYNYFKIFPIKKTFPAHRINYSSNLNKLKEYVSQNYGKKIQFPGLEVYNNRVFFINKMMEAVNLNE